MKAIVVGAGPAGLLLSLMLARADIEVTVLDAQPSMDPRPRASMYGPAACQQMARAGILDDVRKEGIICGDACFRKLDGTVLLEIKDSSQKSSPYALTSLPLHDLGNLILRHAEATGKVQVHWNTVVTSVWQNVSSVTAVAQTSDEAEVDFTGDYLCGCDGANSIVRKTLFGREFPGFTWEEQTVATNVYYPFEKYGYNEGNFVLDPDHYCLIARMTQDSLWRVSYGERNDLTREELIARQPEKFRTILPGHPEPDEYKLVSVNPYKIHQRCAPKFRVGRVLLASDAAHICNPWGGLGLTGGLVDCAGLADCLIGISQQKADEDILDRYCEIRRKIWHEIINPVSSSNFRRVSSPDPDEQARTDGFMALCRKANEDPEAKKQLDALAFRICHDFTQYYRDSDQRST